MRFFERFSIGVLAVTLGAWAAHSVDKVPFSGDNTIANNLIFTRSVQLVDIDRDGDNDVLVPASGSSVVAWMENRNGTGTSWTRRNVTISLINAFAAHAEDIDGDGDLDVVAGGENGLFWYENDGTPADTNLWVERSITGAFSLMFSIATADIDGDGFKDVAATSFGSNRVIWCRNDGTPANDVVWSVTTVDAAPGDPRSLQIRDIDCDGDSDMVVAAASSKNVSWYENVGSPGAGTTWTRNTIGNINSLRVAASGDIDNDGDIDVMAVATSPSLVAWFENQINEAGSWVQRTADSTIVAPASVFLSDVDDDGDLDGVIGTELLPPGTPPHDKISWLENDGAPTDAGVWAVSTIDNQIDRAQAVAAGDMDKDGDIDVVGLQSGAGSSFVDADIVWWRNRNIHRNASFTRQHSVEESLNGARAVASADLNADGQPDIVAAAKEAGAVRVFVSDGSPSDELGGDGNSWTERTVDASFGGATDVAIADINGDCAPDIIGAGFTSNKISWWSNSSGDATTWTITNISTSFTNAGSVYPVDVDRDGDVDVLATSSSSGNVVWFDNTAGNGSAWTSRTVVSGLSGAAAAVAGDINRDGAPDVVAAALAANSIVYYRSSANGTSWTPVVVSNTFTGASAVALADVDADGDLDVFAASESNNEIAIFRNSANGATWTKVTIPTVQLGARGLRVADLDVDGDVDIVSGLFGSNSVVWHENATGNGSTWATRTIDAALVGASGVALADLDLNGQPDVIAAGETDDDIRWYDNLGGQFGFTTSNLSTGVIIQDNTAPILRITGKHNGRVSDTDAEIATFELLFEEVDGDPLSSSEANAVIQDLFIYLDANGNNTFEQGSDTLISTVATLALTNGLQTITFTDGATNARVSLVEPKTYFVVTKLTANASTVTPHTFQITHITEASSRVENFNTDGTLLLEFAANAVSTNTTAGNTTSPIVTGAAASSPTTVTITFSKSMKNDAALTNAANYTFSGGLTAFSVARINATQVSVTTSEMQIGTNYTATVSTTGPSDLEGHFVTNGSNTANFAGTGTAPVVSSATVLSATKVRVLFSKSMTNDAALVTTGNYVIAKSGGGNVAVQSVARVNATTVDLTTAALTEGLNNTLTVSTAGPKDLAGNFVSGSGNTASFSLATVKPKVVSATAVDNTHVTVVFDEAMAAASVTNSTHYVFNNGISAISATVVNSTTVSVTTSAFALDTVHTLTVSTSGPTDLAGNTVDPANNTAIFLLSGTAPTVVSAVAQDSDTVRVTFNENMLAGSLADASDFTFTGALTAASLSNVTNTTVDVNTNEMLNGQTYTLTVATTNGPTDSLGTGVSTTGNTASFSGIGVQPTVVAMTAPNSTTLVVEFSELMQVDGAFLSVGNYALNNGLTVSGVAHSTSAGHSFAALTVSEMLQGQSYTVTVSTTGPVDLGGNPVAGGSNTASTTGVGTKPTVLSASAQTATKVQVVFNEAMANSAALTTPANYTLNNGATVSSVARISATTVELTTSTLVSGTNYTATISTTGPTDLAGNTVQAGSNTAQFVGLGQSPQVSGASALTSTSLTVTFNEDMLNDDALIDAANYAFDNGLAVASVIRIDARNVRIVTNEMLNAQSYTVTVATNGPRDLDSNFVSANGNTGKFSGIGTLPSVVSANATGATTVRIVFSESMTNNSALTSAANYLFDNGLTAANVTRINATTVDVTTSTMTVDESYTVTVASSSTTGPIDLAGNPVSPSLNIASFNALGSNPVVLSAVATADNKVTVTFSEAMNKDAALLLASNYVFDGGLTILSVAAVGVSPNSATQVEITTNEMLLNTLYTLTVASESFPGGPNAFDNNAAIEDSGATAAFVGLGTRPTVQSASATSATSVQVVFSEAMADNAALIALGNYTFTGGIVPLAAVRQSATTVEIAVSEMSDTANYTVTVSSTGPTDLAGNVVSAASNQGAFAGIGEAPVIILVGEATISLVEGGTFTDPGAIATDNFDGDLTSEIVVDGTVDVNTPGTYELSYDVTDAAGNQAARVIRTVIVQVFADLNADGDVNAVDVQLVINAALGIDISPLNGDVNGDDDVNAVDVQLVINTALGL